MVGYLSMPKGLKGLLVVTARYGETWLFIAGCEPLVPAIQAD